MKVNSDNKQNINIEQQEKLKDLQMEKNKLAGQKIPGVFKKKPKPQMPQEIVCLEDIVKVKAVYENSLKQWIVELQAMIAKLLAKNERLMKTNEELKCQVAALNQHIEQLEHENEVLKDNLCKKNTSQSTVMSIFQQNNIRNVVSQLSEQDAEKLTGNYSVCKTDNNVNFRAFYLAMIQETQGRDALRNLLEELKIDQSYKLLPLLSTNQVWVEIASNFLQILDKGEIQSLKDLYEYVNNCSLLDLLFISALRSRVEFLNSDFEAEIDSKQLFMALANNFDLKMTSVQTTYYHRYDFTSPSYNFHILVNDCNEYIVRFMDIVGPIEIGSEYENSGYQYIEKQPNSSEDDMHITPGDSMIQSFSGVRNQTSNLFRHRGYESHDASAVKVFIADESPLMD